MNKLTRLVLALGILLLPQSASALCTILCSCTTSTTGVAFANYNPLSSSPLDSTGNVRVTCGGVLGILINYDIAINKGGYSTSISPRKMASGVNQLAYDLYTSNARSTIWGDGTGGSQKIADSLTIAILGGTSNNHAVHGRIPSRQTTVVPGSYSDTIIVTVTYN